MRSIQVDHRIPLAGVKPLEGLASYREHCLHLTRQTLQSGTHRRERSPVGGEKLEPWGSVDGLAYVRCPKSGSLFLSELPDWEVWA